MVARIQTIHEEGGAVIDPIEEWRYVWLCNVPGLKQEDQQQR